MEKKLEKALKRKAEEDGRGEEGTRDKGGNDGMDSEGTLKKRVEILEDKMKNGLESVRMEDRSAHKRIDKLESEIARDKIERQDFE
jgi:hypothetical protein